MLPAATVSVVILRGGEVLLTQREDFEVWCLPSGHIEMGESVPDAARREAVEETGYSIEVGEFVGVYSTIGDWPDVHSCTFTGFTHQSTGGKIQTPDEVIDLGWFPFDALPDPMLWWQVRRIQDAVNGVRGQIYTERVTSRLGLLNRSDLYRARDESGMSRSEFFRWNFGAGP